MTKNIWAGLIALILVITCGVIEVAFLCNQFDDLAQSCNYAIEQCKSETLTEQQYDVLREQWVTLREQAELLLPHVDLYEINLRFAEGQAYAEQGDFQQLQAQLEVVVELLDYVSHLAKPILRHVL